MTQEVYYVVRKNMLAENYGVHLLQKYLGSELTVIPTVTESLTAFTSELLELLADKEVFLVGSYFLRDLGKLCGVTGRKITVFLNTSDSTSPLDSLSPQERERIQVFRAEPNCGFASFCKKLIEEKAEQSDGKIRKLESHESSMVDYLDNYLYGYLTDEAKNFQYGVYRLPGETNLEKVALVTSEEAMQEVLKTGEKERKRKVAAAEEQLLRAQHLTWKNHQVLIVMVENYSPENPPIVETCELLARHSSHGIGMVARHDPNAQRTLVSCRTTRASGINAGSLMFDLMGGGGSEVMGGAGCPGLVTLEKLLSNSN